MKSFMNEDFLLETASSHRLYHDYAEKMPIIDYHCHINPQEIAEDLAYDNVAEPFLGGDHYKWRLMRACGEPERLVTGDAEPYEKFLAYARTMSRCIGNPVYHWTHLELKRYFGCNLPLNEKNAPAIWEDCNEKLHSGLTVREMIRRAHVTDLATTDDPADDLRWHEAIANAAFDTNVLPAWRPDKLVNILWPGFAEYMERLGSPRTMDALKSVILSRMDFFAAHGCVASDHGVTTFVRAEATEAELNTILQKGLSGQPVSAEEASAYQYALLKFLAAEYARRGWVMEIHYGASRNNNAAMFRRLGPDTGYDAIAASANVSGLPRFLDELASSDQLPKTVLFSLNPNDNAMLNALAGCFQREGIRGAVQQGAAWWFNDTKSGMEAQMLAMANTAPFGNFLGMVTDSRSFLSYTRHEYFRRILCNFLGGLMEKGEYPADFDEVGTLVQDICYHNARRFFGLEKT